MRSSAALAIAEAVRQMPESVSTAVQRLSDAYKLAAKEKLPVYDQFGMLVEESLHQQDPWQERVAIAETFGHLAAILQPSDVAEIFRLLINGQALGDRSEAVRGKMLEVSLTACNLLAEKFAETLSHRPASLSSTQSARQIYRP